MSIKVIVKENYEEVSKEAFNIMKEVVVNKPNAILGLATGSSPIGLYQEMIKDHKANKTSYKDIVSLNLDEYCHLDVKHPESYYSFMHTNLFDHIDIKEENTHLPNGNAKDLNEECERYSKLHQENIMDLQILGIGSNGHIGFNEPGTSFEYETNVVALKEKTRLDNARFFNTLDEVPTHAITTGIKSIMRSKKIVLIATGENKADAIYGMINGPITTDLPASILQKHADVVVIIDKKAASKL